MIKLATVFSGIGSIEWALKKMDIDYQIVFASDSGGIEIDQQENKLSLDLIKQLSSLKKQKEFVDSFLENNRKTNFVKIAYKANYEIDDNHFHFDVRYIDGTKYRNQVDLFVGGSPCQSFSIMGYQKGLEDTRGTLFYDFARLVNEIQPKVFIYENVQGLLRHDKGNTWEIISKVFENLGYKLYHKILDAVDFVVPQKRRRVFVVGFKNHDVDFSFPRGSDLEFRLKDFLIENCDFGNFARINGKIIIKPNGGKVEDKYYLSEKVYKHVMATGTKNYVTKPEIDLDIARPLLATMHKMHRAAVDNYITSDKGVRKLTPRECLRLMGYDDEFKIVVSDLQTYKQAGNSIVVDVFIGLLIEIFKTKPFE
jgi:DNA (cytosine-5)-methyltransferase 1